MNVITLRPHEVEVATIVGTARSSHARAKGYRDRSHVATDERLKTDINAAGAELAASKFIGRRWTMSIGEVFAESDLEPNVEVRFTRHQGGGLIVRQQDKADRVYVLLIGSIPTYRVVGWIRGEEARRNEYRWQEVWKVPQPRLTPFTAFQTKKAA